MGLYANNSGTLAPIAGTPDDVLSSKENKIVINSLSDIPDGNFRNLDVGIYYVYSAVILNENALNAPPLKSGGTTIIVDGDPSSKMRTFLCIPFNKTEPMMTSSILNNGTTLTWTSSVRTSNPNLLDNPWFTINQRGQTTYSAATNTAVRTVDRWVKYGGSVTVTSDGVEVMSETEETDGNFYSECLLTEDAKYLLGKQVTFSILSNGTITSTTVTLPSTAPDPWTAYGSKTNEDGVNIRILMSNTYHKMQVSIMVPKDGVAYKINAAKLEIGPVSTLSLDTAPNYQQELAKCRRYFYRLAQNGYNGWVAFAQAYDTSHANVMFNIPPMRARVSITPNDITHWYLNTVAGTAAGSQILTMTNGYQAIDMQTLCSTVSVAANSLTAEKIYHLKYSTAGDYIDFSAEI